MQSLNKRALVTLGAAFLVVAAVLAVIIFAVIDRPQDPKREYRDPFSGEVVSDPVGKTPDKFGTVDDLPLFLGFDDLIDHGLSQEQLQGLKTAFYNYSKTLEQPLKEISIDVKNIVDTKEERGNEQFFVSNFPVMLDRKDVYKAKIEYTGLNDIRLYIYDGQRRTLVYDSKTIGGQD